MFTKNILCLLVGMLVASGNRWQAVAKVPTAAAVAPTRGGLSHSDLWPLRPTDALHVVPAAGPQTIVGTWHFSPCSPTVSQGFIDTLIFRDDGTYTELHTVFADSSCRPTVLVSRIEGTYQTAVQPEHPQQQLLTLRALKATAGADGTGDLLAITPPKIIVGHYSIESHTMSLAIDHDSSAPPLAYSKLAFPYTKNTLSLRTAPN